MRTDRPGRTREANAYVSRRLREIRQERGLTLGQAALLLADYSDYSWSAQAVSRAELCRGVHIKRWNIDDLYAMAAAFDMPVTYFLPDDGSVRAGH